MQSNLKRDISLLTSTYIPVHPFTSAQDIVERLLPFHVWQVCDEELDCGVKGKGRRMEGEFQGIESGRDGMGELMGFGVV